MSENDYTIAEIKQLLAAANAEELLIYEEAFGSDARKGVQQALAAARRRLAREEEERARVNELYRFERELAGGKVVVGLDEVGRGPLAGPVSVGAVVLDPEADILIGLNDSKQIPEAKRPLIAEAVRKAALASVVVHIPPQEIDNEGIVTCLKRAFRTALAQVEAQRIVPEVVLLDGNPLGIDPREVNVVKGDARCASIAAASVIAKVERDALMVEYDKTYPGYDLASSKGYGSAQHCAAIREKGLSPIHRASYCKNLLS